MNIIIDDEYVQNMGQYISTQLTSLSESISSFYNILLELKQTGIKDGETATALDAFMACIYQICGSGEFSDIGNTIKNQTSEYLGDIDSDDRDLY